MEFKNKFQQNEVRNNSNTNNSSYTRLTFVLILENRYCLLNQRVFALFLLKLGFDLQILGSKTHKPNYNTLSDILKISPIKDLKRRVRRFCFFLLKFAFLLQVLEIERKFIRMKYALILRNTNEI